MSETREMAGRPDSPDSPDRAAGQVPRRVRERFLAGDSSVDVSVRREIRASWIRSRDLAVNSDRIAPTYLDSQPSDTLLAQVAAPVLRSLGAELANEPVAVLLTDADGMVLQRVTHDPSLTRALDRSRLAPGFSYAESSVGTNGIGTAIEMRTPTMVIGAEHYSEDLGVYACAGATIYHPTTGALLGVVDLTADAPNANALLLAMAKVTGERIQSQLAAQVNVREMAVLREYLAACCHTGGSVLALGPELLMMNAHIRQHYDAADQTALLATVTDVAGRTGPATLLADLPSGVTARLDYRPAFVDDALAGGVIRIQSHVSPGRRPPRSRSLAAVLPGVVGASATWERVAQSVLTSRRRNEWLVLEGEAGTGKLALLQGAHHAHRSGSRIHILDASDATSTPDWLGSVAEELAGTETVILRRVHLLDSETVDGLADMLQERAATGGPQPWVAITLDGESRRSQIDAQLLPFFPHTIWVPPLRQHMEDLPRLVPHLLGRGRGRRDHELTLSGRALNQLMRLPWPGNVEQLRLVLVQVARTHRAGVVDVQDLPPSCRATSRRQLSPLEALERDAIIEALDAQQGQKALAATALGMSRASIYRKIKDYGITD